MATANLAIAGASGKMGRMLFEACALDAETVLVAALDAPQSPALGVSAKAFGGSVDVPVTTDAKAVQRGAVLIDFTRPEATLGYLDACVAGGVGMVIGTTGFDEAGKAKIAEAAKHIPIVFSPNYSVGVNTVFRSLTFGANYELTPLAGHSLRLLAGVSVTPSSGTTKLSVPVTLDTNQRWQVTSCLFASSRFVSDCFGASSLTQGCCAQCALENTSIRSR